MDRQLPIQHSGSARLVGPVPKLDAGSDGAISSAGRGRAQSNSKPMPPASLSRFDAPQAYNFSMSNPLLYSDLASTLAVIGSRQDVSAFHGALCGALCREKPEALDPASLLEDDDLSVDGAAAAQLREFCEQAVAALTDAELGFHPLLPDDAVPLNERAQALGAWCEGFLFGLSARVKFDLKACSEEVREVVADFTQFTRASIGAGDDLEVEEGAYAELVEYVRVGAQLVYMELHPRPPAAVDIDYNKTLH